MAYMIRYAIAKFNFMKSLILQCFAAYGIPNLNLLQLKQRMYKYYRYGILKYYDSKIPQFLLRFMFSTCLGLQHFAYFDINLKIAQEEYKLENCGRIEQNIEF